MDDQPGRQVGDGKHRRRYDVVVTLRVDAAAEGDARGAVDAALAAADAGAGIGSWDVAEVRDVRERGHDTADWTDFIGTPVLEVLAQTFPPAPDEAAYWFPDGRFDRAAYQEALQSWTGACFDLAVQAPRLPELLAQDKILRARIGKIRSLADRVGLLATAEDFPRWSAPEARGL
ncbi:MAG: hypothetical protein LBK95_09885 [Bifidobacteriaceae bacterium]|jgi:hypothetical protein|nr:hypothetical protein [Bifidobacteriaceae bacterium]